ncbi:(deoxy)nucleoside triphosphate pyrophosphohydrolase [Desulfopila aestuarii]|uniref:8-oxo-dGTP diphosphatase n=1 Tax=Desulfopila aestuarii DSM 18488 TaxID=1121416 RepID=A0A1M7YB37_9BACT|nr:(deoxy)nucleoside triphosphate pyrophosphohydrolase [Desulfopila aestuarii]SHO49864.1 8-oxo-dGTP diphosphatase [Desulfopila aestuarii DSM 18488]
MLKTTPIITVTAAIIEKDGRILAARKRDGLHLAGYWEFPGGKLEAHETPEDCLRRELTEELGIHCEIGPFLAESLHDYGTKIIRLLGFHARHTRGDFHLTDHDAIRWLTAEELATVQWAPADIPLVDALISKLG